MRIFFCGMHDHANVSNRVARALNHMAGTRLAACYTAVPHPFGYDEDRPDATWWNLGEDDWIMWTGDGDYDWWLQALERVTGRPRRAVQHVGSAYRRGHGWMNRMDTRIGAEMRVVSCDLMRFASASPKTVPRLAPVDPMPITLPWDRHGPLRICHTPSSGEKGTHLIVDALRGLPVDFEIIQHVSWAECVRRRARAHVLLDQLVPDVGAFGQSATEALAQGLVVISDMRHTALAWEILERPPVVQVDSTAQMRTAVQMLLDDPELVERGQAEALAWSSRNTTRTAVASYYLRHLL